MCACVTACEKNNKIDNETTQNNLEELYSETVNCDYTWLISTAAFRLLLCLKMAVL